MRNLPITFNPLFLVIVFVMIVGAVFSQSPKGAQAINATTNPNRNYQWLIPMIPPNILRELNLSADQEAGTKSIAASHKPGAEALSNKMAEARWKMNDAIMSSDLDKAMVQRRVQDLAAAWGDIVESEAGVFIKVRKFLTPEQVALFNQMRGLMRSRQPSFPKVPLSTVGEPFLKSVNLTAAQQEQIESIFKNNSEENTSINRRFYDAKVALEHAIMSDNYDEAAIQQQSKVAAAARGDLIKLHAQALLQIRSVLTPEQIMVFNQVNLERGKRFSRY